jgi:hypothetical protein
LKDQGFPVSPGTVAGGLQALAPLIKPVLEAFVEKPRFQGTCYKAANWVYLGQTKGRGKLGPAEYKACQSRTYGFFTWINASGMC